MSSLNNLTKGAVGIMCCLFVFWVIMLIILYGKYSGSIINYERYPWLNNWFPRTKAGWFTMIMTIILMVIFIGLLTKGLNDTQLSGINRNSVPDPGSVEHFGATATYVPIGYGPVIDKTKVNNWLNGRSGINGLNLKTDETAWLDGNGIPIPIPTKQFRALYGYIPPSIAYFPKGQTKNDYNFKNYKEGRENCMKACSLTNCVAVQTEVPENCSQKANPTEGNSCGNNSEFSCTLFYSDIKNADDAYWTIGKLGSEPGSNSDPGCFETTGSSCLGKKYYEDSDIPIELVDKSIKPSQNPVTFCDPNVTQATNCIKRPLLTTEYTQFNFPYYQLPVNASKVKGAISGTGDYSVLVPTKTYKNGTGASCGLVDGKLVSCGSSKACSQGESNLSSSDCWQVDTGSCSGTIYDQSTGSTQLQTYKNRYQNAKDSEGNSSPGSNYDDLYPSCYYRQKLTIVQPIQFNCDTATVQRGCWGSPPILYTDSLTSMNDIAACSDTSVIPSSERCQNLTGKEFAECTKFPYSCGSNNGSNTLWVRQLR